MPINILPYFLLAFNALSQHLGGGGSSLLGGLLLVYFALDKDFVLCLRMAWNKKKALKSAAEKCSGKEKHEGSVYKRWRATYKNK